MSKNVQNTLLQLIKDNGLWDASNITGLDIIDLINKSGIKINSDIANHIFFELFSKEKIPMSYKEFTLNYSRFDGTLVWEGKFDVNIKGEKITEYISIYATPFWDGQEIIPFNLMSFNFYDKNGEEMGHDDNSDYYRFIEVRDEFNTVKDLLEWYKNFYLPNCYEMIMDEILPDLEYENIYSVI
jgi:hypothetical protein